MQFVALNYSSRCVEKSHFGAVTFCKRVICPFMFKNLSELKSGKECDGFITLVNGAGFRQDDRCFIGFLTLKHFVFLPFKNT